MVAALFVSPRGPYAGLPDVDLWDEARDARRYEGPYPVVAHPPCERWGRYADGGPSARVKRIPGDDGGCFASALASVRRWGGVLEHPADSAAWSAHGLKRPPRAGYWVSADWDGGWTCCVDQGFYGHRAQKATWLYAVAVDLPALTWGKAPSPVPRHLGRRAIRTGIVQLLSKRQRAETPIPFRDLLLEMARSVDAVARAAAS
jgi:hypothetical protein